MNQCIHIISRIWCMNFIHLTSTHKIILKCCSCSSTEALFDLGHQTSLTNCFGFDQINSYLRWVLMVPWPMYILTSWKVTHLNTILIKGGSNLEFLLNPIVKRSFEKAYLASRDKSHSKSNNFCSIGAKIENKQTHTQSCRGTSKTTKNGAAPPQFWDGGIMVIHTNTDVNI